ncbi:MAG TPA: histone H1-like repetitive region-containing protein [Bacteroidales bacterium]|nr:histone H1-like repetitive region-containing protein [Bacteroidales bacterium]
MKNRYITLVTLIIFLLLRAIPAISQTDMEQYSKTIQMADNYFSKGDYINAKASYQIAVKLAPDEQYPKDRLQQSLDMIKVQMYQNSLYTQQIQLADEFFGKKDFDNALKYYQEALTILPGDVYASGKIQEINMTRANNQQTEEDYIKAITAADKLFKEGKLESSLAEYRRAVELKPSETYPKEKAIEVEALIAKGKKITDEYELALQDAELALSRNDYETAVQKLEAAIRLMPGDPLPKQKLAEAQNLKAAWDSYSGLINEGDDLYVSKEFEKARQKYLQALSVKPSEEYPRSMIEKIDAALLEVAEKNITSYEEAIALADQLYSEEKYEQAMVEYKNALRFKPDENYAKQRISDITNALNLRKSQEEAYNQSIAKGDKLYREGQYELALAEYKKAYDFKPMEQYPKVKIAEIESKIANRVSQQGTYDELIKGADKLFFTDNYFEALGQYKKALEIFPEEKYPQGQIIMINEILGLRERYNASVAKADQLYGEKQYEPALLEYRNATSIMPSETYPLEKIRELENIISRQTALNEKPVPEEINEEEDFQADEGETVVITQQGQTFEIEIDSAEIRQQTEMENRYWAAIETGDQKLAGKEYMEAKAAYQEARALKPGEVYAEGKIKEIDLILADIAAKEAAARELAAKEAAEKEAAARELAAKEAAEKEAAEKEAAAKELAAKKAAEKEAAARELAAKEAAEKEAAAKELAAKEAAEKEAAAKELAAKEAAEKEAAAKELTAKEAAEKEAAAKELAAKEAAEKEAAAKELAAKEAAEREAAAKEQINREYLLALETAANYLKDGKLEESRTAYLEASAIKPGEEMPKQQIREIDRQIKERIAELDLAYQVAVSKGDNFFGLQDFESARMQFTRALELKPNEAYPAEQLRLADMEIAKKQKLIQEEYDRTIIEADKYFASKTYDSALELFRKAAALKPDMDYPQEMAGRILKLLSERSIVQINTLPVAIASNTTHKFSFTPVPVKDRKSNYIYFKARNVSGNEFKLIISYGKDQAKNGGVVVKVPAGEDVIDYLVRISAQYKWFSEDNNWITVYPEGGECELSLMQVSYSD